MFVPTILKRTLLVSTLVIMSLLSSGYTAAAAPPHCPCFPLEIFGSQDARSATSKHPWQQAVLTGDPDIENPRYSNPSFPGDETGDSPFFYCPESNPDTDIFDISKIVLNPNPPHINYVFAFHAHGYWREAMIPSKGPFRVRCTVRNEDGGLDFTFDKDFCDFVTLVEMDGKSTGCPPFHGNSTIHKLEFVDFGIRQVRRM